MYFWPVRPSTNLGDPLYRNVISLVMAEVANGATVFPDARSGLTPTRDTNGPNGSTSDVPFGTSVANFPVAAVGTTSLLARPTGSWAGAGRNILWDLPWCIDGWFRPTSLATRRQVVFGDDFSSGGATYNLYLELGTGGNIGLSVRSSTGQVSTGTALGTVVNNTWYHIAVVGLGSPAGNYRLYLNGNLVGSITNGASYTAQQNGNLLWGEWNTAVGGVFNGSFIGQMKGMRMTWGHPRYLTNFVPPSRLADYANPVPGTDASYSNVSLLLKFESINGAQAFVDGGPRPKVLLASGNAQVSTTNPRFGLGCGLFDGAGDFIVSNNDADYDLSSTPFTIEWFMRPTSIGTVQNLVGKRLTTGFGPYSIFMDAAGRINARFSTNGSAWQINLIGTSVISTTEYTHVAVTRVGNVFTLYINGVEEASASTTGALTVNSQPLYIGATSAGGDAYNGRLDELRITKNVARYTANFTPPAAEFPMA